MSSKTYLRYEGAGSFGVIATHDGNVVVDENDTDEENEEDERDASGEKGKK